jgi:CheY-like chemotaxis protein
VDDEPGICEVLAEFFVGQGLSVATARSGSTALRLMREAPCHVVLLDIRMPGMDGLAVLRELQQLPEPPGVIMVTAVQDEAVGQEALALGAADYITKPFDLAYLELSVLSKVITILGGEPRQPGHRLSDLIRG